MTNLILRLMTLWARLGRPYPNNLLLIGCRPARAAYAAGVRRRNGGRR